MNYESNAMTVGELKKYIRNMPNDTPVFMVTDKTSPNAWDDDRNRWRFAHPLAQCSREHNYVEDMFGEEELVLILEVED